MANNLLEAERRSEFRVLSSESPVVDTKPETRNPKRRLTLWLAALLVVCGFALYAQTLHYQFVYDDDSFIVLNEAIRDLRNTPKFFTEPGTLASDQQLAHDNYRPLVTLSFAVNYALGGNDPFGYRLTNILLHVINTMLVFLLALRLFKIRDPIPAFIAAAVFLAHPVQVESVVFVSSRSNLMSLTFFLASWLMFMRRENVVSYVLFAAALLCKEMAIVLPVVIVLWELCFADAPTRRYAHSLRKALPYFLIAGLYFGLRTAMLGRMGQSGYWGGDFYHTMLTMSRGFAEYVRLMVWPHPLSLEYLFDVSPSIEDPRVIGSMALLTGLLSLAMWNIRRRPVLAFGIVFFFIGLSPVSNLIPIKSVINERFLYLSVIGFGFVAADLLRMIPSKVLTQKISLGIVMILGLLTMVRSQDWRDGMALVQATLKTAPQSARMHYGLGRQYAQREQWKKAAAEFQLCLVIDPTYDEASRDMVRMAGEGNYDPALLQSFRQTLQTRVQVPDTLFELGTAYLKGGRIPDAVRTLEAAVKARPNPEWESNLAAAYAANGDLKRAIQVAEEILKQNPEMEKVQHNLAKWRKMSPPSPSTLSPPLSHEMTDFIRSHFPQIAPKLEVAAGSEFEPLPDGFKLKEGYLGSAQPEGTLKPAERATLEALAKRDGSYGQPVPEFFFPKNYGTVGVQLSSEYQIKETPLGASPSPAEFEDGLITYRHVLPHTDVLYVVRPGEMEKMYVLHQNATRRTRNPNRSFEFLLEGNNNIGEFKIEDGKLVVTSARTKQPVLQLSAPIVFDAKGKKVSATYELSAPLSGLRKLVMTFDDTGLAYPLLIDPTWTTAGAGTMASARYGHSVTLLPTGKVLIAGGFGSSYTSSAELYDTVAGSWAATGSMASARYLHTATLLPNGNVLVAGGTGGSILSTAELYNPTAGTWSTTASMSSSRESHTATLLATGKVLVAGGLSGADYSTAELFDPNGNSGAGSWSTTGSMGSARDSHTATLMSNGKVLVSGGETGSSAYSTTEIYDPNGNSGAGSWSTTGSMATARINQTTTFLTNGKVLVAGGFNGASTYYSTAELYDPGGGTWSTTGSMASSRIEHIATLLPSGKLLVAGGSAAILTGLSTAELYDPVGGTWSTTGSMATARSQPASTLLPNGKILLTGGGNPTGYSTVELYNPSIGSWSATSTIASARYEHTATLLPTGKVLVVGGAGSATFSTTELYDPTAGTWATTGLMASARANHSATLLPTGKVLVAGGTGSATFSTTELYDPTGGTWATTGSMATARYQHSATLLPNGKVLVAGGTGSATLSTAELYDPTAGTWSTAGTMASARVSQTATLLSNGKVLMVGGSGTSTTLSTSELYTPTGGTWATTGSMHSARFGHSATLLLSGKVLVEAGSIGIVYSTAELYDPTAGTWATTGLMPRTSQFHTATLLPSGKVLLTGGIGSFGVSMTELYDPVAGTWSTSGTMASDRENHTATLLPNGKVLITGGVSGGSSLSTAEIVYYSEYQPSSSVLPVINSATSVFDRGQTLTITGTQFQGVSEGSGGNGVQSSPGNAPRVYLQSVDSGNLGSSHLVDLSTYVYANGGNSWSSMNTSLTFSVPSDSATLPYGWYHLRVESNGIISTSTIVEATSLAGPGTAKTSAQTGQWYTPATWTGGTVPLVTDTVTIVSPNVVTATATVTVASMTVAGELDLDGTNQAVTLQMPSAGQLTNNGTVKIFNSANQVTFQAQSGSVTFTGNDFTYNSQKIYMANLSYQPALTLTTGATIQLSGPCTFANSFTTQTGSSFIQGTNNDLTLLGNVTLASGTFTKDTGTGKVHSEGTDTLTTNSQDLGKVITGGP